MSAFLKAKERVNEINIKKELVPIFESMMTYFHDYFSKNNLFEYMDLDNHFENNLYNKNQNPLKIKNGGNLYFFAKGFGFSSRLLGYINRDKELAIRTISERRLKKEGLNNFNITPEFMHLKTASHEFIHFIHMFGHAIVKRKEGTTFVKGLYNADGKINMELLVNNNSYSYQRVLYEPATECLCAGILNSELQLGYKNMTLPLMLVHKLFDINPAEYILTRSTECYKDKLGEKFFEYMINSLGKIYNQEHGLGQNDGIKYDFIVNLMQHYKNNQAQSPTAKYNVKDALTSLYLMESTLPFRKDVENQAEDPMWFSKLVAERYDQPAAPEDNAYINNLTALYKKELEWFYNNVAVGYCLQNNMPTSADNVNSIKKLYKNSVKQLIKDKTKKLYGIDDIIKIKYKSDSISVYRKGEELGFSDNYFNYENTGMAFVPFQTEETPHINKLKSTFKHFKKDDTYHLLMGEKFKDQMRFRYKDNNLSIETAKNSKTYDFSGKTFDFNQFETELEDIKTKSQSVALVK